MKDTIIFNQKIFKKYDSNYYVSEDGDVYSVKWNRTIAIHTDSDGYKRVDMYGKHVKIHKLVYLTWIGPIPEGKQINHIDDDKTNNHWSNLYAGTQKQNIHDKLRNNHNVGHVYYLTVKDKQINKTLTFVPAKDFQQYSGHPAKNGGVSRMFTRHWFKKRYELIEYRKIENIAELKDVTTMGDECSPAERSLSPFGAHCTEENKSSAKK